MDWNIVLQAAALAGGVFSTVTILTWWLSGQFSTQRSLFFSKIDQSFDKIMAKLEYHERHDDLRFSEIREDLAEIRVRHAYMDAKLGKAFDQEETPRSERRSTRAASVS